MKKINLVVLALLIKPSFGISIKDAIESKIISATWQGADLKTIPEPESKEVLKPKMKMELVNLTNQSLDLSLDEGFLLEAKESGYQRMLITQKINLQLKPKETHKQSIYALCTQLSHSGPNAKLQYTLTKRAEGALLEIATYIAKNNYQLFAAQDAVWSLTDDADILGIHSSNKSIENQFQELTARLRKVNLPQLKESAKNSDKTEQSASLLYQGKKIDRNIPFKNDQPIIATAGYYSRDGQLLQSILDEKVITAGTHSIRYDPYPLALHHQRYSVRMYQEGELFREYFFRQ